MLLFEFTMSVINLSGDNMKTHLNLPLLFVAILLAPFVNILLQPKFAHAADCRKYQNEMIRYVKIFRGTPAASEAPFYNAAVSRNAQRNSKLVLKNQSAQNFFRYPTYGQVVYYGFNDNIEAKIGNSWVPVNPGANWNYVTPSNVANTLIETQGDILGAPARTKIGVGCEETNFIGRSYVQNGFRYRRHIIKRAWTIALDSQ